MALSACVRECIDTVKVLPVATPVTVEGSRVSKEKERRENRGDA